MHKNIEWKLENLICQIWSLLSVSFSTEEELKIKHKKMSKVKYWSIWRF